MKKNFKFMLVALLALFGFNNAFAADLVAGDVINDNAYYYKIKSVTPGTNPTGTVYIQKINSAKTGEIILPQQIEFTHEGKTYTFNVTGIEDSVDPQDNNNPPAINKAFAAFKDQTALTKVTIPSTYEYIGSNAFYGCTNLANIDLSGATGLKTIADQAFVTIQVQTYDFSACTKLTGFVGEPFVEAVENKTNSYVKAITLPESSAFKSIGTALSKLPNLETQNIKDTKITAIVAEAFKGDGKLKSLELPGTVKTIAGNAFKGSSVETLTIDATSIQTIGDGQNPVYGVHPDNAAVLKSLTITGELKGVIMQQAFAKESKLETLLLSCTFGTTGQIKGNAFAELGDKITKVTLGDITDNGKDDWTICSNAFTGKKLTEVEIGDITAPKAIAANAFYPEGIQDAVGITKVTIGDVKTTGTFPAIAAGAFVFADDNCTLTIGDVRSTNAVNPVMGVGAFDFGAVSHQTGGKFDKTVTITIGAVEAKGNNFSNASITSPAGTKKFTLTFTGDIEEKAFIAGGVNATTGNLLSNNGVLDELTFQGKVAEGGITEGAFAGLKDGAKVTFEASLAGNAVEDGAFTLGADVATTAYTGKRRLTVIYSGTPDDATVIPFQQHAFLVDQLDADAKRSVTLTITGSDDLNALIAGLQISIDNPAPYANANADIIYAVKLIDPAQPEDLTLLVYQKTGTTNSYGRWFLKQADYPHGLIISRRGNEGVGTLTLYTTYVENDAASKVVVINMQPIPCVDGKYYFKASDLSSPAVDAVNYANYEEYNQINGTNLTEGQYNELPAAQKIKTPAVPAVPGLVVIAKATGTSADETEIVYVENTNDHDSNPWYTDNAVQVSAQVVTNEQLRDGSGAVQVAANQDLYFITNPKNHNGVTAPTYDFRSEAAKNVFIDNGSFYLLAPHYDNTAAARIVWLDGSEDAATGIENVKAANAEGAIFNLAGQQVDANYKGIVIKGGKKVIQK